MAQCRHVWMWLGKSWFNAGIVSKRCAKMRSGFEMKPTDKVAMKMVQVKTILASTGHAAFGGNAHQ